MKRAVLSLCAILSGCATVGRVGLDTTGTVMVLPACQNDVVPPGNVVTPVGTPEPGGYVVLPEGTPPPPAPYVRKPGACKGASGTPVDGYQAIRLIKEEDKEPTVAGTRSVKYRIENR